MTCFIKLFVETLLGNICYNNIDKVMNMADELKWYFEPAIVCIFAFYLMLIVMAWSLLSFPWNILKSLTFWLDFLQNIVNDYCNNR